MYFENPLNQPDLRLTLATGVEGRKGDTEAAVARWNMRTFCRVCVLCLGSDSWVGRRADILHQLGMISTPGVCRSVCFCGQCFLIVDPHVYGAFFLKKKTLRSKNGFKMEFINYFLAVNKMQRD